jgi:peptide/nickel transport system permease protein
LIRLVLRRLPAVLLVAWGVTTLVFVLVQLVPGRPLHELGGPEASRAAVDHLRTLLGTDRPIWQRYVDWFGGLARGDLGFSIQHRRPVRTLVGEAVANTVALSGAALLLEFVLGTALGAMAAWYRGRWFERLTTAAATITYSVPSFWIGLVLVWLFSIRLGWLPVSQMHSLQAATLPPMARLADGLKHLMLPCVALMLPSAAGIALYVRDELLVVLGRPFVAAARARGASPLRLLAVHGFRNALLPVIQLLGLSLPGLVGGSVVIEFLFAWPGVGRLAYDGLLARDEPLVLGCTLIGSLAVVLGTLVADVASAAVVPRVRGVVE